MLGIAYIDVSRIENGQPSPTYKTLLSWRMVSDQAFCDKLRGAHAGIDAGRSKRPCLQRSDRTAHRHCDCADAFAGPGYSSATAAAPDSGGLGTTGSRTQESSPRSWYTRCSATTMAASVKKFSAPELVLRS